MKRLTLISVFCLLSYAVFAQLNLGVKGGLNLTNISTDMLAGDYQIESNPGSQIGYHFGGLLRVSLFGMYVQPELVFTSVAAEYTVTDQITQLPEFAKQRIGRVDIPLLIGAKLGSLRLGVGPVASIIVSDKNELTDITGYETSLKSATFGYQLGLGLNIWKVGFDIRYEGNLSKLGDQINVGGQPINFDSRARQIIFSLSYEF
jgi:hypothetical protein